MKIKRVSTSRALFNIFNYLFFGIFILLCTFPLWYVLIYTISDPALVKNSVVILWPRGLSFTNLERVFELNGILPAIGISVLRTTLGTFLTLLCCTWLGYLFTKDKMPFRKFFYRLLAITMYISGGLIPTYLVYKTYGMVNNFLVYIIPGAVSAYYIILIKTFIEQLPASLEESAWLDGAGPIKVFSYIILPLSKPIVATVSIYSAVSHWNSWFDNHIYTSAKENLTTLQYMLYNYLNEAQRLAQLIESAGVDETLINQVTITPWGVKMTVTLITILPIIMIYPFMQRFFIKGIMVGAVKG
jgi:multiple sugar transport system permease protein/putative aldouronate transport system permease protein